MERVAARSTCGDQRGGSPQSSAVQCESSSPLQLPPLLTMVLHCFSSGSAAHDGDLCGEGREEGGCAHAVLTVAVLVDSIGAFQVQLMPWGR